MCSPCFAQGGFGDPPGRTVDRIHSHKTLGLLPDSVFEIAIGEPPLPSLLPPPSPPGPRGSEFDGRDSFSLAPRLLDSREVPFTAAPFIPAAPSGTIPAPAGGTLLLLTAALWAPRRRCTP